MRDLEPVLQLGEVENLQEVVEEAWRAGLRQFDLRGVYQAAEPSDTLLYIHRGLSGIVLDGGWDGGATLDGAGITSHVITVEDAEVTLRGLTILGGDTTDPARVAQTYRGPRTGSVYRAIDGAGVLLLGNAGGVLDQCTLRDNHAGMCGGGLSHQASNRMLVHACLFEGNTARHTGGAIDNLMPGSVLEVSESEFRNNTSDRRHGQITLFPGTRASIHNCDFEGDAVPADASRQAQIDLDKNHYNDQPYDEIAALPSRNLIDDARRLGRLARFEGRLLLHGSFLHPGVGRTS